MLIRYISPVSSMHSLKSVMLKRTESTAPTTIIAGSSKLNSNNKAQKRPKTRSIRNLFRKKVSFSRDTTSCASADDLRVRFSNIAQSDIIEYNSFISDKEKTLMYFSKSELAEITKEIIALVIKGGNPECNLRGLETIVEMRTLSPSQPGTIELRKKYIKQIVAEYRAIKRKRKLRETLHEHIRKVSEEATEKNRNDGYKLGMVDMNAAGISTTTTTNFVKKKTTTTDPVLTSLRSLEIQKKAIKEPTSPNSAQSGSSEIWC